MLVTVIAYLCLAAQVLPQWMEENGYTARGYHLAKWGCVIGGRKRETA